MNVFGVARVFLSVKTFLATVIFTDSGSHCPIVPCNIFKLPHIYRFNVHIVGYSPYTIPITIP